MKNEPQIGRKSIKGDLIFLFNLLSEWAPNRPKADKREYYTFNLILLKNEPQIGRKSIKGDLIFLFNLLSEWAPNRPKADKGRYLISNFILLKNEPQIGRRPIKRDMIFFIYFCCKMNLKSAGGRWKRIFGNYIILLKN